VIVGTARHPDPILLRYGQSLLSRDERFAFSCTAWQRSFVCSDEANSQTRILGSVRRWRMLQVKL
jgi:hypothetical protein